MHAPEKLEEYYQRKRTAIRVLEYKEDTSCSTISSPNSSPTSLSPLDTGLPLQISATCLMQYNEQPVDSASTLPTGAEVPQGQLASYNHDDLWLYTGAAFTPDERMNDHEWDQLFTVVLNAAAVKSPTAFTGGSFNNALGFDDIPNLYPSFTTPPFSEGSGLSTDGSANSSTFLTAPIPTRWDAYDGVSAGLIKSEQPPQDIYHPATTPGRLADQQQRLRQELRDCLRTREFDAAPGSGSDGGRTGPGNALKRPSLDEVAMWVTPKCARTSKRKMKLTRYYCSKCRTDDADHQYENCPTWRQCGFCDKQGHWSFHCTTPHVKCTRYRCGVHVGHRNIGDIVRTSAWGFCF